MLNEADRKYMERTTGKQGRRALIVLFCSIFLMIGVALINIYMAGLFASLRGYSFHEFLMRFGEPISLGRSYSGVFLKASERFTVGCLEFLLALYAALTWWSGRKIRERNQRIINSLKSSGSW